MEAGGLVSDEIVLAVLARPHGRARTSRRASSSTGFPAPTGRPQALDALLAGHGQRIDAAVSLEVDDAAMVTRIAGRYTCAACGEGYHDSFKQPAAAGTCDKCGGTEFKRRADDNAETVAARLEAYHAADRTADRLLRGAGRAGPGRRDGRHRRDRRATFAPPSSGERSR